MFPWAASGSFRRRMYHGLKRVVATFLALESVAIALLVAFGAWCKHTHAGGDVPPLQFLLVRLTHMEIEVYTYGSYKYAAMLDAIRHAERRILLDMFIWKDDEVGREFKADLRSAAERGAEVYIIVDGLANLIVPRHFKHFPSTIHTLPQGSIQYGRMDVMPVPAPARPSALIRKFLMTILLNLLNLNRQVAVVTSGTRVLGRAVARRTHEEAHACPTSSQHAMPQTRMSAMLLREERVRVDGIDALLRVQGSGPPLVLVHGLGCSGRYFAALQHLLAADFMVYTPDLPGHGHSQKPRSRMWRVGELTDWLAALIRTLGLAQPIVGGHSMGGGIAVDLATRYAGLVRGVVLLSPTGVPKLPPVWQQLPLLLIDGLREPLRLFPLIIPAYLQAGPRRYLRLAIDQARRSQRMTLRRMTPPMLVMQGTRGPIVTRAAIENLRTHSDVAQVQAIPGAAHALHVSHPRPVAAAIGAFAIWLAMQERA